MNIWKRGVCLLLTLVMAAALAGCGTRREPQTLRVCLPELPGTLDPAMVTTDSERIVVSHLYENLMKLSSDGQGGSRVEAGAAREYACTDNSDGTQTYTFTLRDMKWSDGRKDGRRRILSTPGSGWRTRLRPPPMRRCWRWWRGIGRFAAAAMSASCRCRLRKRTPLW